MLALQGSGLDKRQTLNPGEAQDTDRRFLENFLKFLCGTLGPICDARR